MGLWKDRGSLLLALSCLILSSLLLNGSETRPVSIFTHGNGLFYGSDLSVNIPANNQAEIQLNAEDGYRPVHANTYMPAGANNVSDADYAMTWVWDDDSAFPSGVAMQTTTAALEAGLPSFAAYRPISISAYRVGVNETRYSVVFLRDDSGIDWKFVLNKTGAQYQAAADNLDNQGYRALSVSGCSHNGSSPRFSAIYVKDGMSDQDWATQHGIREVDYQDYITTWKGLGFWPISLSAYAVGGETYFTAVMVRSSGSGAVWAARHGLTAGDLAAENNQWTSETNPSGRTLRPVTVAAYHSGGVGGPKRFAAVWRSSSKRVFHKTGNPQPLLSTFDDAMENIMKSKDVNAASLCVAKNGQIKLHRSYTWAPDEYPVTPPNARFRIASASKAVTATAVMKLLESNIITGMKGGGLEALTLDTLVFQMMGMPDLPADYGSIASGITIRHLLRHRAGWSRNVWEPLFSDITVANALGVSLPLTRQDMLDYMMNPALWPTPAVASSVGYINFPDQMFTYSNFGFAVLAELIEVVSGETYEEYVRRNILLPVGANRTRLGRTARLLEWNNPDEVIYTAGSSTSPRYYVSDSNYDPMAVSNPTTQSRVGLSEPGASFPTTAYGRYNVHTIDGAGGWVSTSDDLVRLLKSFNPYDPGVAGSDTPLLDWGSMWEMWSNPANISAVTDIGASYVLGWQTTTVCGASGNVTAWYHAGAIDGSGSIIVHRSDGVSFAAVLSRETIGGVFTTLNNVACAIASWPICISPPVITTIPNQTIPEGTTGPITIFTVSDKETRPEALVLSASSSNPDLVLQTGILLSGSGEERSVQIVPLPGRTGTATIIITATDGDSESTSMEFEVTVIDRNTPPTLDRLTEMRHFDCLPFPRIDLSGITSGARAEGQLLTVTAYSSDPAQLPHPTVHYSAGNTTAILSLPTPNQPAGSVTITVVVDGGQLTDNTISRAFIFSWDTDLTPPELFCPTNILVHAEASRGTVVHFEVTAQDNIDGPVGVDCEPPSGSLFPVGTTTVTCLAEDACGNVNSCSFRVTVQPPLLALDYIPGARSLDLSWTGSNFVLEEADELPGPWRAIRGAVSPHKFAIVDSKHFFNLAPGFKYDVGETFNMELFEQNIRAELEDNSVGFSYAINLNGVLDRTGAWGKSRTAADDPELNMTHTKRVNVASVSKTITAVAVLNLLEDMPEVDVDSPVATYLPSDWVLGPGVAGLTFKDLLTHKSGLAGSGSGFEDLRGYIQQGLGSKTYKYQNSNFAMFRIIIPYLWGIVPWAPNATVEEVTAEIYQLYVQENIFTPMGIMDAWNKPTDTNPMLLYRWPDDGTSGYNPGDFTLKAGAYGWNLSAYDLAAFLAHLRFGTILEPVTRAQMDTNKLGWGASSTKNGDHGTYYGHNGGLKYLPLPYQGMRSCIMDYPNGVQVSLIINCRDADLSVATLLKDAFDDAWQ